MLSKSIKEALRESGFSKLTKVQERAIPLILKGKNLLIIAPVASGKIEAAILPLLSRYKPQKGIVGLYITPLRALNRDMLKRISYWAKKRRSSVMVRHGDTSIAERRKQAVSPPSLLITTPKSLQIILVSKKMREHLKGLKWVVDEVHEIASCRRGVQLSLALERLRLVSKDFQVIGLSATVGNPKEVAKLLVEDKRKIIIVESKIERKLIYKIECPFSTEENYEISKIIQTTPEATARLTRIRELIEPETSTLIFVNSRTHTELISTRLSKLVKGVTIHHGSISKDEREDVEEKFRNGRLKGMVCTSTVELGIDIGYVDLVIQYMSPRQVSALIQRVGRSGHKLEKTPKGIVVCAFPEDVIEACVIANLAEYNKIENAKIHKLGLNVLNHQFVSLCLDLGGVTPDFALTLFKKSYLYKDLSVDELREIIRYAKTLRLIAEVLQAKGKNYAMNLDIIRKAEHYARLKVVNLIDEQIKAKAPVPSDKLILFETYRNFLVIHACLRDSGIRTLAYLVEPIIANYRGIRDWWTDGYRILFESSSPLNKVEVLELIQNLKKISKVDVKSILDERFGEDFPFGYYLKFVAERFGAIKRGISMISMGYKELERLIYRFKDTPVFEETLRKVWPEKLDLKIVSDLIQSIKEGKIKIEILESEEDSLPLSFSILNKFVEVPELITPELIKVDALSRLKGMILSSITNLLYFNCLNEIRDVKIKDLCDKITCSKCNSSLLTIVNLSTVEYAKELILRRKKKKRLDKEELEFLSRVRRSADLVLSYGKKAVIAQMVYGIGPQTASRILARTYEDEEEFYSELLKAKINFILTRPFWDRE